MFRLTPAAAVRAASCGEVTNPETLDFRTLRPVPGGIFCERIFGPVGQSRCLACDTSFPTGESGPCGSCPTCGVRFPSQEPRSARAGHIELPMRACHPIPLHAPEHPLAEWCGVEQPLLEALAYHREYFVLSIDADAVRRRRDAWLDEVRQLAATDPPAFAEIREALGRLPRRAPADTIPREAMTGLHRLRAALSPAVAVELEAAAEIRTGAEAVVRLLERAENPYFEQALLECLLVIPAGQRDFRLVDGHRVRWHAINETYRRVIHRCGRVRKLTGLHAPSHILDAEAERLQELVDALVDNMHAPRPLTNDRGERLPSLSDFRPHKE